MKTRKWDRHEIYAAIKRKGSSLRRLSLASGLNASSCCKALRTSLPSGEAAIADFLGVTVQELWPDRYPTLPTSTPEHDTSFTRETSLNGATAQTVSSGPTRASQHLP